jgi:antimicrobial peptide system SdpB family protein
MSVRIPVPWTWTTNVARSLLALQCAVTLSVTPTDVLFTPFRSAEVGQCVSIHAGLFWPCWFSPSSIGVAQHSVAAVCVLIACGFAPALTAVPLACILVGFAAGGVATDGGDQLAGILGLLLLPVSLTDARWNPWASTPRRRWIRPRVVIAASGLWLVKVQVSVVYLVACIGKLSSAEWSTGTALYYWTRNVSFGAPDYLRWLADPITASPWGSALLTWGTLGLEFGLAVSFLVPVHVRLWALLPLAIMFHLAIWFVLGVSSFALVMIAAVLLLLVPIGSDLLTASRRGHS